MFEKRIPLFSLFGFEVSIDITWFILVVLITWSLAKGVFPHYFKEFSHTTYWWMVVAGVLGLFVSFVFHDFCNSIVTKRFGLSMKGIKLFIFGGVAEMSEEQKNSKSEFFMAIAGPISNVFLAGIFFLTQRTGKAIHWPQSINAVLVYLVLLNLILAGFNLIPAIPLGGQYKVDEIASPCSDRNVIPTGAEAMKALSIMKSSGNSRLMVVDGN